MPTIVGLTLCGLLVAISSAAAADVRLVDAARDQNATAIRALLKQRIDVNAPSADGSTALHWAAHWDDGETVALLLQAGANTNAANELGVTPLYLACSNGSA